MSARRSRRRFLQTATYGGTLLGLGDLGFMARLQPVRAAETVLDSDIVRLRPEIEPLVRLIEETPRGKLLEEIAYRLDRGLSYRELLAGLMLAAVRNIQPRPSVGFKFHAVLAVNSAHLASMSSPDSDRWLPIFWGLDNFKSSQARDVQENDWTMAPVDESAVPPAHRARRAFIDAMESWDVEGADAAVAGLSRSAGSNEIVELMCRFGGRDFRDIGHKAIFVANASRTLNCIGWQHAEPVLRSLAYAMLNHEQGNPAQRDAAADRPWKRNMELAKEIRDDWQAGQLDSGATEEMLAALRNDSDEAACRLAVELLNRGTAPQSIWDALFTGSGELLMRQTGIVSLHSVTSTNALHYAYSVCENDTTRRLLLLQNAAFLPLFREAMKGRGDVGEARVDQLAAGDSDSPSAPGVEEIFADVRRNRASAARKTMAYLAEESRAEELIAAARRLVFLKGGDSHDYKFSSAVFEDFYHTSPKWRNRYLAANTYYLHGSGEKDTGLVERTRAALRA